MQFYHALFLALGLSACVGVPDSADRKFTRFRCHAEASLERGEGSASVWVNEDFMPESLVVLWHPPSNKKGLTILTRWEVHPTGLIQWDDGSVMIDRQFIGEIDHNAPTHERYTLELQTSPEGELVLDRLVRLSNGLRIYGSLKEARLKSVGAKAFRLATRKGSTLIESTTLEPSIFQPPTEELDRLALMARAAAQNPESDCYDHATGPVVVG